MGFFVGNRVGYFVGISVGLNVGCASVGYCVGFLPVGLIVGGGGSAT